MPIHSFKCERCGDIFDWKTDYNPPNEIACPKCYGKAKRLFTAPTIKAKWTHGDIGSRDNWERYEE